MKTDIDRLMERYNVDALLVTGPAQHNPMMVYLTGGAHLTRANLVVKRGGAPILFHSTMERDEAARTGFELHNYFDFFNARSALLNEPGAAAEMGQWMLEIAGITSGRMQLYGLVEAGDSYAAFSGLQSLLPDLEIVNHPDRDVLKTARETKGEEEIDRIRKMGKVTTEVVAETADFLTGHTVRSGVLMRPDGEPLRIGDVKRKIDLWLMERGAENPEGTIFAIGRDAGVPHSSGTPDDVLCLGKTIVYDIFPREAGGGYFHDFTRTWCLGYATDEAYALHEQVRSVYEQLNNGLKVNMPFFALQEQTCELFEAQGHPTVMSDPRTEQGYVHNIGHGVGLNVHESPWSRKAANGTTNLLSAGTVIAIEPGLYYPEQEMGVRLENTYAVHADGVFECLAPYPLDLVLPMKES